MLEMEGCSGRFANLARNENAYFTAACQVYGQSGASSLGKQIFELTISTALLFTTIGNMPKAEIQ